MYIRKLETNDYEDILVKWWKDWRWEPPLKDLLPDNGEGGWIVYDGETPVCAGFNYITNSKVGWSEFIVSNFDYKNKKKRKEAINLLILTINKFLQINGCKYVYTSLKNKSLVGIYKDLGYQEGSNNCLEMIKKI